MTAAGTHRTRGRTCGALQRAPVAADAAPSRGVRRVDTLLVAAEACSGAIVLVLLLLRDHGGC